MVGIEGFRRNTSLTTRSSRGNSSRSSIEMISPYARHSSRRRAWISGDPARWKRHQDIMILGKEAQRQYVGSLHVEYTYDPVSVPANCNQ